MAEQRPQPPLSRDSRRKFLVRSAKLGAAGLPLMATLHHRSALAQACWGGESTAGSMDLSGRHGLSDSCASQGFTLGEYLEPASWPSAVTASMNPNAIKVQDLLGGTRSFGAGASGFNFANDKVITNLLVNNAGSVEASAIQTLLNAYNAEEGVFPFAISPEFAKQLIQTLFTLGDAYPSHSFNLPPADNDSNSISAFFSAING